MEKDESFTKITKIHQNKYKLQVGHPHTPTDRDAKYLLRGGKKGDAKQCKRTDK